MRFLRLLQRMIVHICIICSLTIITVHVLDWYNPFMDFEGHARFVLYTLCIGTLISGLLYVLMDGRAKRRI